MDSLLSSKSANSRRMLLLSSPDVVDARDLDSTVMDTSEEHRSFMKNKLYGQHRQAQLQKSKVFF